MWACVPRRCQVILYIGLGLLHNQGVYYTSIASLLVNVTIINFGLRR